MRYQNINNNLFIENRKKFIESIKDKSAAVFVSNDLMPTNADEEMPFIQNTNLFYLTGIDQEDTFLILAPDFPDKNLREILFIKETSEEISIWEGNKLTKNEIVNIIIKTYLYIYHVFYLVHNFELDLSHQYKEMVSYMFYTIL